jgi:hypothetical protein
VIVVVGVCEVGLVEGVRHVRPVPHPAPL